MRSALVQAAILITTLVAAVLVAPPLQPLVFHGPFVPLIGVASGVLLFFMLSRRSIPLRALQRAPKRRLFARSLVLTLKSAQEEALWRGVALGLLIGPAGRLGALVLTTVAFASAHASTQGRQAIVHLLTGSVFGASYVLTGSLTAAIGSHAAYNVLVGAGLLAEQNLSVSANSGAVPASIASRLPQRDPASGEGSRLTPPLSSPLVASLQGVRKRFGRIVALDGVDVELRRGEIVALLGPNGAGKSTAVAIMLGLRRPDAGTATLRGGDPRRPASRRDVGAVLQEVTFPSGLRVKAAVDLVRAHFPDAATTEAVLRRLDLGSDAERDAGGLSGGQRRRLAVALALAGRPTTLFLDEPTAGMDASARRALLEDLASFAADGGAVLLTTQQLAEAEQVATRVVLLAHGRVILEGTVAEIRARGGLSRVMFRSARLPPLAGVASIDSRGDRHVVYVDDADRFVADLVRADIGFHELEIARSSLEDAFVTLVNGASP